jgi:hypothetical protein
MLIIAAHRFDFDISFTSAALACFLAAFGWLAGLWTTTHPLLSELRAISYRPLRGRPEF